VALYFEYDSAVLHPRAEKQLDIVSNILKAASHKKLRIGGHTDAKGSDTYNIDLSQRRATAVKQYILSRGVPEEQVETIGFGKSSPLSPNVNPDGSDNPEGRSRNRRAEILLDF
jgi:outer membrane protein OmpA-like peptidoglycan-associated protein